MRSCLDSVRAQSIFDQTETIVADNQSSDGSDHLCEEILSTWPDRRGRFIQNGGNYGYCKGNNLPAKEAQGKWLFFLNNDARLESDTLEVLIREAEKHSV